jgi:ABC-type transporter MlaC component
MNKRFTGWLLMFAFLLGMPLQGYAATPKETVETGVNNVLKTLGDQAPSRPNPKNSKSRSLAKK